jgi:hypothetical protein
LWPEPVLSKAEWIAGSSADEWDKIIPYDRKIIAKLYLTGHTDWSVLWVRK